VALGWATAHPQGGTMVDDGAWRLRRHGLSPLALHFGVGARRL